MDLIEKVRQLASLMEEQQLAELEVEEPNLRIRIKGAAQSQPDSTIFTMTQAAPTAPPTAAAVGGGTSPAAIEAPTPAQKGLVEIRSPMVGTFYRAPSEGAEPYVSVGIVVDPDSVVCIVEAMKVMNEVKAEASGEIVEVLVQNSEPVEYGQVLFLVKPLEDEAQ